LNGFGRANHSANGAHVKLLLGGGDIQYEREFERGAATLESPGFPCE